MIDREGVTRSVIAAIAKVRRVLDAVSTIADTEVAFKVVKSCVNYGRVMHLLRTVPFSATM